MREMPVFRRFSIFRNHVITINKKEVSSMKKAALSFFILAWCAFALQAQDVVIEPFKDCAKKATLAKPGEYILTPSYNWQKDATLKGAGKQNFIFYHAKMKTPGPERSRVLFTFDGEKEIPNYMIIPIPAGQRAKKGDVVLTWWQSGSGMNRGYVVNDDNPAEPMVRYLDIEYDNPAKNKGGVPIGQMEEKLKPDTFVVIRDKMSPGTAVAVQDTSGRYVYARIVSLSDTRALVLGFSGKMSLVDRSKCIAPDIIPAVREGDMVQFPWAGIFKNGTVKKIDTKIGRVFIDFSLVKGKSEEKVISFGNILKGLAVK
jgi:hypothetical protein